jgi:alpha-glucan,water dikinase
LQTELYKGVSIDEIQKKITKGEIKTEKSKQLQNKRYFSNERIRRKKWDIMQLVNKHAAKSVEDKVSKSAEGKASVESKFLKAVELFAKKKEEHDGGAVLNKKIFKLADKELLVQDELIICPSAPSITVFHLMKLFLTLNLLTHCQGTCNEAWW